MFAEAAVESKSRGSVKSIFNPISHPFEKDWSVFVGDISNTVCWFAAKRLYLFIISLKSEQKIDDRDADEVCLGETLSVIDKRKQHMKNSRFKFFLIPSESLVPEAQELQPVLKSVFEAYDENQLTAAEFLFLVIAILCQKRRSGEWWMKGQSGLSFRTRSVKIIHEVFLSFGFPTEICGMRDFFENYRLKKLPEGVSRVLHLWDRGEVHLELVDSAITPLQMLDLQAQGRRVVTISRSALLQGLIVDGQRDALEFLLHDLVHADLFFKENHEEQVAFFSQIKSHLESKTYESYLRDPLFQKDFEYVISDMNSCRIHLESCLKAAMIESEKRGPSL